jgi:hypothetical protein
MIQTSIDPRRCRHRGLQLQVVDFSAMEVPGRATAPKSILRICCLVSRKALQRWLTPPSMPLYRNEQRTGRERLRCQSGANFSKLTERDNPEVIEKSRRRDGRAV